MCFMADRTSQLRVVNRINPVRDWPGSHPGYHQLFILYPDSLKSREKFLAVSDWTDSVARMIQSGFLSEEDRIALTARWRATGLRLAG
jgi:hypothetical protein